MKRTQLKACLAEWMKIPTWNTSHPLDEKRFHKALAAAFDEVGTDLEASAFEDVMAELAKESQPMWPAKDLNAAVNKFAERAANIAAYLHDVGR